MDYYLLPTLRFFPAGDVRSLDIANSLSLIYDYDDEAVFIVDAGSSPVRYGTLSGTNSGSYITAQAPAGRNTVEIVYSIPRRGLAQAGLSTINGKAVAVVFSNVSPPGMHSVRYTPQEAVIAAGRYVLTLRLDGSIIAENMIEFTH
ncbi:MAG: hypothetical protein GF350_12615 [Chitinivibrionales bacterium]|nr:hypothetical protein [Chitinivibrionales bacterium]